MTNEDPGRELVRLGHNLPTGEEIDTLVRLSKNMAESRLFPDALAAPVAFAKIMLGRDLGLGPTQALTGIHIVEGKPQIAATTLAGFVRQHPTYDYRVVKHDEKECEIEFTRTDQAMEREILGTSTFTLEEAKKAELVKAKSAWEKYPRNMLFARAMSNGVRFFCPDLFGGIPVYTEADEFTPRASLSAGEGDGAAEGIALPPAVEEVLDRAEKLGHAALANRAAVETVIGGIDDEERVAQWVARAHADLDMIAASEPTDVDVLPDDDDAEGWRARSAGKLDEWRAEVAFCNARSEPESERAKLLKEEADTALQTALGIDEGGVSVGAVNKTEGEGGEES